MSAKVKVFLSIEISMRMIMRKLAVLVLIAAIAAAGCTPDEIIQPDEIIDNGETELLDPSLVWSEA